MNRKQIFLVAGIILVIAISLAYLLQPRAYSPKTACETLSEKFDDFVEKGCFKVINQKYNNPNYSTEAAAVIIEIKGPEVFNSTGMPVEYWYDLVLKGKTKQASFSMVSEKNTPIENLTYKIGDLYKLDFAEICGPVMSMGPHGGGYIFTENNAKIEQIACL
jgi:hypothetical protein